MSRRRAARYVRTRPRRQYAPLLEQLESRLPMAGDVIALWGAGHADSQPQARPAGGVGVLEDNVAPRLDPLELSSKVVTENGTLTVTGEFLDPDLADTHTVEIFWGGGIHGQDDQGTTVISTAAQPAGSSLTDLGGGRWRFTAEHLYADDSPSLTGSDSFTIRAKVTDSAGGVSASAGTALGGNIFLTGHSVLLSEHQNDLDVIVLDHLRGAGQVDEIPREEYDIGYLREFDLRGDPGQGLFGTLHEASLLELRFGNSFADFLSQIDVLYVPYIWDLGGFDDSFALNSFEEEIQQFFDAGGDLFVESSGGLVTFYDFLPSNFEVSGTALAGGFDGFEATPEGAAIGITESMVEGFVGHHQFTAFDEDFTVFEVRDDQIISIGLLSAAVRVENVPPVSEPLQLGAVSVTEGGEAVVSGTFSDVGLLDTHSVVIDWGDDKPSTLLMSGGPNPEGSSFTDLGNGAWSFSATHRYADDNPTNTASDVYAISVTVADDDSGVTSTAAGTLVHNLAPSIEILETSVTQVGAEVHAVLSGTYLDAGVEDTHEIVIDWGVPGDPADGTTTITTTGPNPEGVVLTDLGNGLWQFEAPRVYQDSETSPDVFDVSIVITDDDGGSTSDATVVAVANVPPTIEPLELSSTTIIEGQALTIQGRFTDPGLLDTHTITIDWGGGAEGQPAEGTTTITTEGPNPADTQLENLGDGSWGFSAVHTYTDDSPTATGSDVYEISVTVADNREGVATTGLLPITLENAEPVLDDLVLSAAEVDAEGQMTLTGTFVDPGTADAHTVVIDWGDASIRPLPDSITTLTTAGPNPPGTTLTDLGDGTWAFSAIHQYLYTAETPESYLIRAIVTDDDLGSSQSEASVPVVNLPPQIAEPALDQTQVAEGSVVTVSGQFSDRVFESHLIQINWGGGVTGQPAEGITTLTTAGPNPAGTTLTDLGNGNWSFTAEHTYLDDNPTATEVDGYTVHVTVADDRGGLSTPRVVTQGGNVFVTGHSVMVNGGQEGFDRVILDYLRGAGTDQEIARDDYRIGYLRTNDRGEPGGGAFGTVIEADPADFADGAAFSAFLDQIDALYVAFVLDIDGGTGSEILNGFARQIGSFFSEGGDIAVEGGADLQSFYDFLPASIAVSGSSSGGGTGSNATEFGTTVGITPSMVDGFGPLSHFTSFVDGYRVLETRGPQVVSLGLQNFSVHVRNEAPVIDDTSLVADVNEVDREVMLSGRFSETSILDSHQVTVAWGDGTESIITLDGPNQPGESLEALGNGVWSLTAAHQYPANSPVAEYTIVVSVVDDDLGADNAAIEVTVSNPLPVLNPLEIDDVVTEGEAAILFGTFADPGPANEHTLVIHWGDSDEDGESTTITTDGPLPENTSLAELGDGLWGFSAVHTYRDDNPTGTPADEREIVVTLTDDTGQEVNGSTTVVVNNAAPLAESLVVDQASVNESESVSVTGFFTDVGLEDSHTVTIDWGDSGPTTNLTTQGPNPAGSALSDLGDGRWGYSAAHSYHNDGEYTITALIADDDTGEASSSVAVVVENQGPTIETFELSDSSIDEDGSVIVTGRFFDPGLDDTHRVELHWGGGTAGQPDEGTTTFTTAGIDLRDPGDGTPVIRPRKRFRRLVNLGEGWWSFTAAHQYLDDKPSLTSQDSYTISATVTDGDGAQDSRTATLLVNNVVPEVTSLELSSEQISEGESATLMGTFFDPRISDTHEIEIEWNDGAQATTTISTAGPNPTGTVLTNLGAGNWAFSATHRYDDDDPTGSPSDISTITVRVADDDLGATSSDLSLVVNNVPPELGTLEPSLTMIANDQTLVVSGTLTDVGIRDTHTLTIDWGVGAETILTTDGPNPAGTVFELDGDTWTYSASHQYSAQELAGRSQVVVQSSVRDDDGGSDVAEVVITPTNEIPEVGPLVPNDLAIPEGGVLTVTGTFHDPSATDSHTVEIDWGGEEGTTVLEAGQALPSGTTLTDLGDGNWQFTASHRYLDDNPTGTGADEYTIRATVTDSLQASDSSFVVISVNDVLPVVEVPLLSSSTITESGTVMVTGRFSDVGVLDTHTILIEWAGGEDQVPEGTTTLTTEGPNPVGTSLTDLGDGNWEFTAEHTYFDDNPNDTPSDLYTIRVTVTDDDTVSGTNATPLVVNNAVPVIDESSIAVGGLTDGTALVGQPVDITMSFTDIGRPDTHNVIADWRDGDTSDTQGSTRSDFRNFHLDGGGFGFFTVEHIFRTAGVYDVEIVLADDDGGTDSVVVQVTVEEAAGGGVTIDPDTGNDPPDSTDDDASRGDRGDDNLSEDPLDLPRPAEGLTDLDFTRPDGPRPLELLNEDLLEDLVELLAADRGRE